MRSDRSGRRNRRALQLIEQSNQARRELAGKAAEVLWLEQEIAQVEAVGEPSSGPALIEDSAAETPTILREDRARQTPQQFLRTPEQNIKKHINSPNLMIPNKVGKPLSWYNEFEFVDLGGGGANTHEEVINERSNKNSKLSLNDSEYEPDMAGVEENVDTLADAMNEGRGRVRNSSLVFANKDLTKELTVVAMHSPPPEAAEDFQQALADFRSIANEKKIKIASSREHHTALQGMVSEEEAQRVKQVTRSSDCVSLPTEIEPNFAGWQNLEVNANHNLLKDSSGYKKKSNAKNNKYIVSGASSSKIKDP